MKKQANRSMKKKTVTPTYERRSWEIERTYLVIRN